MDFLEIELGVVDTLHDDLILRIPSAEVNITADTYYFSFYDSLAGDNGDEKKVVLALTLMLNEWRVKIDSLNESEVCFLPFDFSDHYIGCFRFENIQGEIIGIYGYTEKIVGWMIDPSRLEQFDIEDPDFTPDSRLFGTKKSELLSSLHKCLEKLKHR